MVDAGARWAEVENAIDTVEELCEAVREAHRVKTSLKERERLVEDLMTETKELLGQIDAGPVGIIKQESAGSRDVGPSLVPIEPLRLQRRREPVPAGVSGRRLKARRIELGLSQTEIARKAGVTQSQISRIELEHGRPSPTVLARIVQALRLEGSAAPRGEGAPS